MNRIKFLIRFIKFYLKAKTKYHVHSPFLYDFTEKVLEDNRYYYVFEDVEDLREALKGDDTKIEVTDFGAGSQINNQKERSLSSIIKHSAISDTFGKVLFRLVNFYKPKTLLELGTSLGVSSIYQAAGSLDATLITLEGCMETAEEAVSNFEMLEVENIQIVVGKFEDSLPEVLSDIKKLDYVFFDGNHRKAPTLQYFNQCLENAHEDSIFVFDDIHWSEEMESAWEEIKKHPKVLITIDLFFLGIVFFKNIQNGKKHYKLIKSIWKPWKIGVVSLFKG